MLVWEDVWGAASSCGDVVSVGTLSSCQDDWWILTLGAGVDFCLPNLTKNYPNYKTGFLFASINEVLKPEKCFK